MITEEDTNKLIKTLDNLLDVYNISIIKNNNVLYEAYEDALTIDQVLDAPHMLCVIKQSYEISHDYSIIIPEHIDTNKMSLGQILELLHEVGHVVKGHFNMSNTERYISKLSVTRSGDIEYEADCLIPKKYLMFYIQILLELDKYMYDCNATSEHIKNLSQVTDHRLARLWTKQVLSESMEQKAV